MARLSIDLHVQVAHAETQEAARGPADDQDDHGGTAAPGGL
jgi:2'-hydroxyisoflavone reductase